MSNGSIEYWNNRLLRLQTETAEVEARIKWLKSGRMDLPLPRAARGSASAEEPAAPARKTLEERMRARGWTDEGAVLVGLWGGIGLGSIALFAWMALL